MNSLVNWLRIPASLTNARLVCSIIAMASAALLNETVVMFEPDVVLPMMSMFS
ncbi:hypothetical protein D3C78_1932280 [compost metagenome]